MHVLTLLHRWWGVVFCLLFAMWFASGVVMHFVPFPERLGADRFAGGMLIDRDKVAHGPSEAVAASDILDASRVRLAGRRDGPVYFISGASAVRVLRAADLGDGGVHSEPTALDIATASARSLGFDVSRAGVAERTPYDQWTVSGEFDPDRPLYRIALNDESGTEFYVSSTTGDVVLVTTLKARALSYLGSVVHWLYPTALRRHKLAWSALMWWLSLVAAIGASLGVVIGLLRLSRASRRARPAYRGLQAWHHRLGLAFAPFILSWIFSGFLSMDDGRLFSSSASPADARALAGAPAWDRLPPDEMQRVAAASREIEWFALAGHIYRRERRGLEEQRLSLAVPETDIAADPRSFLREDEIDFAAKQLGRDCGRAAVVGADKAYRARPAPLEAPVFRVVCGNTWYEIDGATGALLNRLDPSRRAYRWLFNGLHRLDFPALQSCPLLRTIIVVALCLCGLAFSLSGAVLAWRRLPNPLDRKSLNRR
jgi:PepSY-associated TM region